MLSAPLSTIGGPPCSAIAPVIALGLLGLCLTLAVLLPILIRKQAWRGTLWIGLALGVLLGADQGLVFLTDDAHAALGLWTAHVLADPFCEGLR